jgi:cell wall-associated NlpC family hydrolase
MKLQIIILSLLLTACGTPSGTAPLSDTGAPPTVYADVFGQTDEPATEQGRDVAVFALSLQGIDYRYGGKYPDVGFDCSGLVTYVFKNAADITLEGNANTLATQGKIVNAASLRVGDLVFFNTLNRPFSHVGIYLGEGNFIHAPSTNGKVRVDSMNNVYFKKRFEGARRVLR